MTNCFNLYYTPYTILSRTLINYIKEYSYNLVEINYIFITK